MDVDKETVELQEIEKLNYLNKQESK